MVKTGNRIYKNRVTKLLQIRVAAVFIPYFFSQYTFNSDPEHEHFHFLPGNPKRPPTKFRSVSGL